MSVKGRGILPSTLDPFPGFECQVVLDFELRISNFLREPYLFPYWTKVQYTVFLLFAREILTQSQ